MSPDVPADGFPALPASPVSAVDLVDFGLGPYVHGTPSTRFPVYTRGNAGEVYPEVVFPFSASLTATMGGDPAIDAMRVVGIMTDAELTEDADVQMGVFGGYTYLNLSASRVMAERSPGATAADTDATFLGSEGVAPPHVSQKGDRNLGASLRGARFGLSVVFGDRLPRLEAGQEAAEAWRAGVPPIQTMTDDELIGTVETAIPMMGDLFRDHLLITGASGIGLNLLRMVCEKRLGDATVALDLLGGIGDVASAAPSHDLWALSRMVRDAPAVATCFTSGLEGLEDRLAAEPAAAGFLAAFERFLSDHGSRGPNEWEVACEVWDTDHRLPLAIIDRMWLAGDDHDPAVRAARLAEARAAAVDRLQAEGGRLGRRFAVRVHRSAVEYSRARERSKALLVKIIHECRLALRELGRRLADRSGGRPDDLWFVLHGELPAYRVDPAEFADVIGSRRATRDALSRLVPPFAFSGTMPPPDTWDRRVDTVADPAPPGTMLTGIPGCNGVARGRARVVLDPADPGDLGPGDVLVAPITDPAWTPLFVPVEAVVVDVGGQMSHAVIVSRELGLPCVVAVTGATRRIADGALVEVDGNAGTVRLVDD